MHTPQESDARRLHAAQLVLELLDLVPDAGGDLELQFRCGQVHLLGEFGNEGDEVPTGLPATLAWLPACPCPRGQARAGREPRDRRLSPALLPPAAPEELLGVGILTDQLVEDVRDPLPQRHGVEPALAVVGDLLV